MFFWNSLAFYRIQWILAIWSGSSVLSKSRLNIWKFSVHVLLRPSLENFEHYFASIWDKYNCVVVWTFLALPLFVISMKTDIFQSCGHCSVFQICWHIKHSSLTASSLRIWSSSAGIPSLPLALLAVMLPKAHLSSQSRMSGSSDHTIMIIWVMKMFFAQFFCVFLPPLLNIFCFC